MEKDKQNFMLQKFWKDILMHRHPLTDYKTNKIKYKPMTNQFCTLKCNSRRTETNKNKAQAICGHFLDKRQKENLAAR